MMAFDSQSTSPSSSIVGTRPLGLRLRYRAVFTTPNAPPASIRSYPSDISSQHHSTFWTLTELFLPQITSISTLRGVNDNAAVIHFAGKVPLARGCPGSLARSASAWAVAPDRVRLQA